MNKQKIIFLLGVWVALLPFLGFPTSWKKIFFILSGVALIALSYTIQVKKAPASRVKETDIFTENGSKAPYQTVQDSKAEKLNA